MCRFPMKMSIFCSIWNRYIFYIFKEQKQQIFIHVNKMKSMKFPIQTSHNILYMTSQLPVISHTNQTWKKIGHSLRPPLRYLYHILSLFRGQCRQTWASWMSCHTHITHKYCINNIPLKTYICQLSHSTYVMVSFITTVSVETWWCLYLLWLN